MSPSIIDKFRALWMTNSLVLLYDLAFLNRLLLDVEIRRAIIVNVSILLIGGSGIVYAVLYQLSGQDFLVQAAVAMLVGVVLFGAATWQRTVRIGFPEAKTKSLLESNMSLLIDLSQEELLPALVERSLTVAQRYIKEDKIPEAQSCTDFAQSIWINTVLRQHTNIKGLQKAYEKYTKQVRDRVKNPLGTVPTRQ